MSDGIVIASIATAILAATPVLIAASGELLSERVGVYNLGIEGSMLLGAFLAVVATNETGSVFAGLGAGILAGLAASTIFAFMTVVCRAELVMSGLAIFFLAQGLTVQFGSSYVREPVAQSLSNVKVPLLADIPWIGPACFEQISLTYLAFLLPLGVWFLLYRTRHGLNLRTVGEGPNTADVAGVKVNLLRFAYTAGAGAFSGLAGAFLTLGPLGTWVPNVTAGQGFLALIIVIFASWKPFRLIAGALLFGVLTVSGNLAQAYGWNVPSEVFSALPYIGTFVSVCVLAWIRKRQAGWPPWPAGLGEPFFRGSRDH